MNFRPTDAQSSNSAWSKKTAEKAETAKKTVKAKAETAKKAVTEKAETVKKTAAKKTTRKAAAKKDE